VILVVVAEQAKGIGQASMDSTRILDQLDSLIDDLLIESDLPACSLASMLIAARDSVRDGYHFVLARRVWRLSNEIRDQYSTVTCISGSNLEPCSED
jgi:hypothetical protein